jgi:hypothetical protein
LALTKLTKPDSVNFVSATLVNPKENDLLGAEAPAIEKVGGWPRWPLSESLTFVAGYEAEIEVHLLAPTPSHSEVVSGPVGPRFATPECSDYESDLCDWLLKQCGFRDRWWSATGALHVDFAQWRSTRGSGVALSRLAFETALEEQGFYVKEGLVHGLALMREIEAFELFNAPIGRG